RGRGGGAARWRGADRGEAALRHAGVGTAAASLLRLVRQRTRVEPVEPRTLDALINGLGDEDFGQRERAGDELFRLGRAALPALDKRLDDPDPEVRRRARRCAEDIRAGLDPAVTLAAVRLLVRPRAEGGADAQH